MVATANELFEKTYRRSSGGYEKRKNYIVQDAETEQDALAASGVPAYGDADALTGLPCTNLEVEPVEGVDQWKVIATFSLSTSKGNQPAQPEDGDECWNFDGSGTTITKRVAISQAKYGATAPDVGQSIGVTEDGTVQGVEVYVPHGVLTVSLWKDSDDVGGSYLANALAEVGKVNSATWYGQAAGSVLFTGFRIQNQDSQSGLSTIDFSFAISPNESNLSIDDISVSSKKGWEYIWSKIIRNTDTGKTVIESEGVYVAQVYPTSDFSALGLSGSL